MTLTARVALHSLTVMALVLTAVAVLMFEIVTVWSRSEIDRIARDEADRLVSIFTLKVEESSLVSTGLDTDTLTTDARQALASYAGGPLHLATILVGDSRLRSDTGPASLIALANSGRLPQPEPGLMRTVDSDAGSLRSIDVPVLDGSGSPLAIVSVLVPQDETRSATRIVLFGSIGAGLIGLAIGSIALPLVVRRSLRPLKEVTQAVEDISLADLSARVPVPPTRDEVAELAMEFNRMIERIADDEDTRRRYLAAISHEVRTPLAIAEGHLEMWETLGPAEGQSTSDMARTVQRELERLRRVLDDLLAVARGSDEVAVRSEPVFLPDVIESLRSRISGLGHANIVIQEPPPDVVMGDQARIEQALLNVLKNAVEHNPSGTCVDLSARVDEDHITFTVKDNGPGIPAELLPRVFDPFVTSRDSHADRIAGLGLAVVQSLTRAQGGFVKLNSNSSGTTVEIALRRALA
jgi:two-component system, OmpR family, sensor kinase